MNNRGFTIIELLVVLAIISIMVATAVSNLKVIENPLNNASSASLTFLQLARAKAISQTKYCKVYPSTTTKLVTAFGSSCDAATAVDNSLSLNYSSGTRLADTTWSVCFTPRGFSKTNETFVINDNSTGTATIEVALGGASRII